MTTLFEGMPNSSKTSRGRTKKKRGGGEVIHVAFGPGGGRIQHADASPPAVRTPAAGAASDASSPASQRTEPVTDVFSPREVAKLLGLTPAKLRSLEKA